MQLRALLICPMQVGVVHTSEAAKLYLLPTSPLTHHLGKTVAIVSRYGACPCIYMCACVSVCVWCVEGEEGIVHVHVFFCTAFPDPPI